MTTKPHDNLPIGHLPRCLRNGGIDASDTWVDDDGNQRWWATCMECGYVTLVVEPLDFVRGVEVERKWERKIQI